jgi:MFS family permease
VLFNLTYALLSYPAGYLADRLPHYLVFTGGMAMFAAAFLGLGLAASGIWVWVLFPVYGAYMAFTDGVGRAWVSERLPESRMGFGIGIFNGLSGAAALVAGIWVLAVTGRLGLVSHDPVASR